MTDPDYRHVIVIVDRSGSMHDCRAAAQEGVDGFFAAQAAEPGRATASLYQFDTVHDTVFEHLPLDRVPRYELVPRGGTALLDAIGFAFTREGEWLSSLPEQERPGTVIALITTDGLENSSREYTREAIHALITQQREVYSWQVVFIGGTIDAVDVAVSYGVAPAAAMAYAPSAAGTSALYRSASSMMRRGRAGLGYAFTDEERAQAMGAAQAGGPAGSAAGSGSSSAPFEAFAPSEQPESSGPVFE